MKSIKLIMGVLLVAFIAGGIMHAQPKNKMKMRENMHEKLNLTEQQEQKIEGLRTEHQKKMIDLKAELEKRHIEMRELQSKGNYSRSDFLGEIEKISKIKDQIAKQAANHRMDVYEQLTPDQKKIFDEKHGGMGMRNGFGGKGMNRMGMGPKGMGMGVGNCPR